MNGSALSLLAVMILVLAEVALGPGPQVSGAFGSPPFLAAMFTTPRRTALIGLVCTCVALAAGGAWSLSSAQLVRGGVVATASATAVLAAETRRRTDRRVSTISEIAEIAQLAVLRRLPPRIGPVDVAVRSVSSTSGARIGGDFYEAVAVGTGVRALLGDVRGHGLGAVQQAGALVGAFRGCDHDHLDLAAVVRALEMAFHRTDPSEEDFATAIVVEVSPAGEVELLNCGHPSPLLVRRLGGPAGVQSLPPPVPRPPIGFGPVPSPARVTLAAGDRLVLFTDGISEARAPDGRWFDLASAAGRLAAQTLPAALAELEDEVRRFVGGALNDDVTVLALEFTGTSSTDVV